MAFDYQQVTDALESREGTTGTRGTENITDYPPSSRRRRPLTFLSCHCVKKTFISSKHCHYLSSPISPPQFFRTYRPRRRATAHRLRFSTMRLTRTRTPAQARAQLEGPVVCAELLVSYSDKSFSVLSKKLWNSNEQNTDGCLVGGYNLKCRTQGGVVDKSRSEDQVKK
jgi:hypothetical protein